MLASLCLAFIGSGSKAQANRSTPKRVGLLLPGSRRPDAESYETHFLQAMAEQGSKVGRDFDVISAYCDSATRPCPWSDRRADSAAGGCHRVGYHRRHDCRGCPRQPHTADGLQSILCTARARPDRFLCEARPQPHRNHGVRRSGDPEQAHRVPSRDRSASTRLFWLWGTGSPSMPTVRGPAYEIGKTIESDAASMGITARVYAIRHASEMQAALAEAAAWKADAVSGGGVPVAHARERADRLRGQGPASIGLFAQNICR